MFTKTKVKYFFAVLAFSIFLSETLIMLFLNSGILPPMSELNSALLDATLLLFLTFPMLYFFAFLPQIRTAKMLFDKQAKLMKMNEELNNKNQELQLHSAEKVMREVEFAIVQIKNIEKEKHNHELIMLNESLLAANLEYTRINEALTLQNIETEKRTIELFLSYEQNTLLNLQVNHMQKVESIGRMTSGIAHDFNNILTCMLGYNEMNQYISDEVDNKDSLHHDLKNNIKQIDKAGQKAISLIKKMLSFCHHDNLIKMSSTLFLQESIIDVLEMLRPALTNRIKVNFHRCDIGSECGICPNQKKCDTRIQIESIDLQQILTNLAINARDAIKEYGGMITFSTQKVTNINACCVACATAIEGDFVELCVSDNGSGINPEIISRLFDPFFTTKPQGEGTGLGLSAVSNLVHQAGGHILVDSNQSEFNHHTAFRLLFPPIPELEIN